MSNTDNHTGHVTKSCVLCGETLEHLSKNIENVHCDNCRQIKPASARCKMGHVICNDCLNETVFEFVKNKCLAYKGNDPIELVVEIMNSPLVNMHGPEHHYILPSVMLTVTPKNKLSNKTLKELLEIADERISKEVCVDCSTATETCGAAMGAGIFIEIINGLNEKKDDKLNNLSKELTDKCFAKIKEHGGPKCCKRDTYFSIQTSIDFLKEKYGITLPQSKAKCTFSLRNKSCGLEKCIFYNLANSLV